MPYNKDAYSRYKLIDARLRHKQLPNPTLQDLIDFVAKKMGKPISISAIQKDLEAMRYDKALAFNAPIIYHRPSRTYCYSDPLFSIDNMHLSEEDLQGLDTALGILQQFKNIPAIKYFQDAIARLAAAVQNNKAANPDANYLLLDRPDKYLGSEFLPSIVEAIREKKVLKIMYQSFNKPEPKEHVVHPYFIKEYDQRLYVIANDVAPGKAQKLLTFSLDRIKKIKATYDTFKATQVDKANYYKNALGISYVDGTPEKIVLSFLPSQAGYLTTQPLHHSQKIVVNNKKEFRIELKLIINPELQMRLLSQGSKVRVLEPKHLRQYIVQEAKAMANG